MCAQFKANVGKADVSCSHCGTSRSRLPWDWEPCKFAQLPPVQVLENLRRQSWTSLPGARSYGWIDWCSLDQWYSECFDSSSGKKLGRIHVSALPDRGKKSCNATSSLNRLQWSILSRLHSRQKHDDMCAMYVPDPFEWLCHWRPYCCTCFAQLYRRRNSCYLSCLLMYECHISVSARNLHSVICFRRLLTTGVWHGSSSWTRSRQHFHGYYSRACCQSIFVWDWHTHFPWWSTGWSQHLGFPCVWHGWSNCCQKLPGHCDGCWRPHSKRKSEGIIHVEKPCGRDSPTLWVEERSPAACHIRHSCCTAKWWKVYCVQAYQFERQGQDSICQVPVLWLASSHWLAGQRAIRQEVCALYLWAFGRFPNPKPCAPQPRRW